MTRTAGTANISFRWSMPLAPPVSPIPLCFDETRDWALWNSANRFVDHFHKAKSPCADCLSEFKQVMIKAGRCQKKEGK